MDRYSRNKIYLTKEEQQTIKSFPLIQGSWKKLHAWVLKTSRIDGSSRAFKFVIKLMPLNITVTIAFH